MAESNVPTVTTVTGSTIDEPSVVTMPTALAEPKAPADTTSTIPEKMKRLVLKVPGDLKTCELEIEEVPVPSYKKHQLLIKVVAAAVNPSDFGRWKKAKPGIAIGNEGSGIVVASGGGLTTFNYPVGTKVGFVGLKDDQGSYSEYVVADALGTVFTMPSDLPIEDAAAFFVNPYTVVGIFETVKSQGAKAFVHTAAASQLGQMMLKLAPKEGLEIVCVVQKEEQAELVKGLGAKHVVVTGRGSDERSEWKKELKEKIDALNAFVAFDAVAGKMSGDLLDLLPPMKGTLYIYGGLAGPAGGISPLNLVYDQKQIKGFGLQAWVKKGGIVSMLSRLTMASSKVNAGLKQGGWCTSQFKDISMDVLKDEVANLFEKGFTGVKLRIRFDK